ncbi:DUF3017 domain-containing protein [Aeromicrobium sp. Leaf350]|uniref:DUF3017 domain-containing protein n=1 Tax=Aeromicrobium sp. Leaf350 TaxID=2876565 RepID=UPI001E61CDE7|nr:DUF3017 domain-containing protein [Aeromicrobium sp. Leaf350]
MRSLLKVPRSRGTQAYIVLLLVVLVGLVLVGLGHWRRGIVVVGGAFIVSAGLRAVVPEEQKGLLAVRSRGFDVAWTAFLGISLAVLGFVVPPGPDA